jgi:hypothetical protein
MAKKLSMSSKKLSKKNQTRKMGGGAKLPTATHAVIKRAKKAIQKLLLNKDDSKTAKLRETAEEEIANANKYCGSDRRYWREEVLIASNKEFSDTIPNSSWYTKVRTIQWSLTKMPAWAHNGKDEPNTGTIIEGKAYTKALPSQPR